MSRPAGLATSRRRTPSRPPPSTSPPTGIAALSGDRDGTVKWRSLRDGKLLHRFETGEWVVDLWAEPEAQTVVITGRDQFQLWDLREGRLVRTIEHDGRIAAAAVSGDGRRAVSGGNYDPVIRVWDLEGGRLRHRLEGHVREARGLDISADGRFAVSVGGTDRTVRLWDLDSGRCRRTFVSEWDETAALSADGRVAAAGG